MHESVSVTVRRQRSVSGGNDTARLLVGLLAIGVVLVVGYFVLAFLLKFAGWVLLLALGGLGAAMLFGKRGQNLLDDQSKPAITAIADEVRKNRPDYTDEQAYKATLLACFGTLVFMGLATLTVALYAASPAYQHVPMNYIGLASVVLLVFACFRLIVSLSQMPRWRTEPAKKATFRTKVTSNVAAVAMIVYPLCIVAVNFGVF